MTLGELREAIDRCGLGERAEVVISSELSELYEVIDTDIKVETRLLAGGQGPVAMLVLMTGELV